MARVAMVEAVTMALAWELEHDESVVILGEDVGINGGVFRATAGLAQRCGEHRVIDTPLAETMIAGLTVGMATQGMKPVAEAQFMGFIYPMLDHILSHAGRMRHRTRGRLTCPMVLRAPYGGGIHAPEHHSESTEALFAHMPGVRVVIPSSPSRAYGLLLAAIREPDPVVFLEPKRIYRLNKEEVEDDGEELPLDVCYVLRDGSDVTLVTWGAMVKETLEAAEKLAAQGISARTAHKWLSRYRLRGRLGLRDQSSAPRRRPTATPRSVVRRIQRLRCKRLTAYPWADPSREPASLLCEDDLIKNVARDPGGASPMVGRAHAALRHGRRSITRVRAALLFPTRRRC